MNKKGTPKNLVAAHQGNTNARRHGAYSPRIPVLQVAEIVEELMSSAHVRATDRFAIEEIARLWTLIEAIDADLAERGLRRRDGGTRSLIDLRLRASGRLERWLRQALLTPAARAAVSPHGDPENIYVHVNPMAALPPESFVDSKKSDSEEES